jgi:IstB-like ATP binding protein
MPLLRGGLFGFWPLSRIAPFRELRPSARRHHRGRQLRHRQDPRLSGARSRGLPEGVSVVNTAAALVHELLEARDEKRLLRLQRQLAGYKLLIIDELGYVPLSQTGAELLFEVFSQRYERGSTIVTSNLPFDEWTSVFGSERLTPASSDTPADNPTQA